MIGYWDGPNTRPGWPRPEQFVDTTWDADERELVADYLSRGHVARAYMGYSECRMRGRLNGSLEFTDGFFVWPEGLRHYVVDHAVRLPARFVEHAQSRIELLESAPRDEAWWSSLR
ncbi:hypothetical protein [Cellulomonas fimi]|uniref:hypothetical protein n=1 Tax=Cellulomonas fimi TaxID=1708 RepID=UPI001E4A1088|nr:hypothetical protein [Cellulomonas fimi]